MPKLTNNKCQKLVLVKMDFLVLVIDLLSYLTAKENKV